MSAVERFNSKYEPVTESGCWIWMAGISGNGYGEFWLNGATINAHRAAWLLLRGDIRDGLEVCHHCDVPLCVNPAHLYLGTNQDNMRDKRVRRRAANADKTHCIRGHEFTEENTYRHKTSKYGTDGRWCKTCRRQYMKAYFLRRKSHD